MGLYHVLRAGPENGNVFFARGWGCKKGISLQFFWLFPRAVCPHGCVLASASLVHATFTRTPVDLVSPLPRCYVALCL